MEQKFTNIRKYVFSLLPAGEFVLYYTGNFVEVWQKGWRLFTLPLNTTEGYVEIITEYFTEDFPKQKNTIRPYIQNIFDAVFNDKSDLEKCSIEWNNYYSELKNI